MHASWTLIGLLEAPNCYSLPHHQARRILLPLHYRVVWQATLDRLKGSEVKIKSQSDTGSRDVVTCSFVCLFTTVACAFPHLEPKLHHKQFVRGSDGPSRRSVPDGICYPRSSGKSYNVVGAQCIQNIGSPRERECTYQSLSLCLVLRPYRRPRANSSYTVEEDTNLRTLPAE